MAIVQQDPLADLRPTIRRYEERAPQREQLRRTLADRGILHADSRERVAKRLARLGCDWALAGALDRTPAAPSSGRSLDTALGPDDFGADVLGLERLMGRNDLIDVGFLERGHLAARSIGRITVRAGNGRPPQFGTGWLVSPRLLLTNNHVLRDAAAADRAHVEFNVQSGLDGLPLTPACFKLDAGAFFATDVDLDFTFVAVAARGTADEDLGRFGYLRLVEQEGKVILGERVNIIQHPNGEPKQLALRENTIVDVLERFLHYETDTAPGSSGAPVFNDQFEVVALHHKGVPKTDADGHFLAVDGSRWTREMGEPRLAWKANEGARISRVLDRLRQQDLVGEAGDLRAQLLEAAPAPAPGVPLAPVSAASAAGEIARVTVPVHITISVTAQGASAQVSGAGGEP